MSGGVMQLKKGTQAVKKKPDDDIPDADLEDDSLLIKQRREEFKELVLGKYWPLVDDYRFAFSIDGRHSHGTYDSSTSSYHNKGKDFVDHVLAHLREQILDLLSSAVFTEQQSEAMKRLLRHKDQKVNQLSKPKTSSKTIEAGKILSGLSDKAITQHIKTLDGGSSNQQTSKWQEMRTTERKKKLATDTEFRKETQESISSNALSELHRQVVLEHLRDRITVDDLFEYTKKYSGLGLFSMLNDANAPLVALHEKMMALIETQESVSTVADLKNCISAATEIIAEYESTAKVQVARVQSYVLTDVFANDSKPFAQLKKDVESEADETKRKELVESMRDAETDEARQKEAVERASKIHFEGNFAEFSAKLGAKIAGIVKDVGDFCSLNLTLRIPVAPGFYILLSLGGEIENLPEGVMIAMNAQLGAGMSITGLADINLVFGGWVETCGKDPTHALQLMSYTFYRRAKARNWSDSYMTNIWGITHVPESANVWAEDVERRMSPEHYAQSGANVGVNAKLGNGLLGAEASGNVITGTRWQRDDKQSVSPSAVKGGDLAFKYNAGACSASVMLQYLNVSEATRMIARDRVLKGTATFDVKTLGGGTKNLVTALVALLVKANDKLDNYLYDKKQAYRKDEKVPATEQPLENIFESLVKAELRRNGLCIISSKGSGEDESKELLEQENPDWQQLEKQHGSHLLSTGQYVHEKLHPKYDEKQQQVQTIEKSTKPINDAMDVRRKAVMGSGSGGGSNLLSNLPDVPLEFGKELSIEFMLMHTGGNLGGQWSCELFLTQTSTYALDLLWFNIEGTKGHKHAFTRSAAYKRM